MSAAKDKGTRFERSVAEYLAAAMSDDRIMRMPLHGSKDHGDIAGLRSIAGRVCVECKNVRRMALSDWYDQAVTERGNSDAAVGIVVHKRALKGQPGDQWVTMTLRDLVLIMGGDPL